MSWGASQAYVETLQSIAYAPVGQQAYAFIIRRRGTTRLTGLGICDKSTALYAPGGRWLEPTLLYKADCSSATTTVVSEGTRAYRINLRDNTITPLSWSEPLLEIAAPMIHENGQEALLEVTSYEAIVGAPSGPTIRTECKLQFRDLLSGTVHLSPGICGPLGGQGGFGAVRAPGGS